VVASVCSCCPFLSRVKPTVSAPETGRGLRATEAVLDVCEKPVESVQLAHLVS
jgi:hypothetical protein